MSEAGEGEGEESRLGSRLKETAAPQQITEITHRSPYRPKIKATAGLSTGKLIKVYLPKVEAQIWTVSLKYIVNERKHNFEF